MCSESLAELGAQLRQETETAYRASEFSALSRDYLRRFSRVVLADTGGGDPEVPESFTLSASSRRVAVRGRDPGGLRDAVVRLVDIMGMRQAHPFVPVGEVVYSPLKFNRSRA